MGHRHSPDVQHSRFFMSKPSIALPVGSSLEKLYKESQLPAGRSNKKTYIQEQIDSLTTPLQRPQLPKGFQETNALSDLIPQPIQGDGPRLGFQLVHLSSQRRILEQLNHVWKRGEGPTVTENRSLIFSSFRGCGLSQGYAMNRQNSRGHERNLENLKGMCMTFNHFCLFLPKPESFNRLAWRISFRKILDCCFTYAP